MKVSDARRWLAIYFLLITAVTGGYLLIFGDRTFLLPMSRESATSCFQILIPVLIGQITIIFRWISHLTEPEDKEAQSPIPEWAIKLPPILVVLLIAGALIGLVAGNGKQWGLAPEGFKSLLTFAVSLLNASTVFLVSKLFEMPNPA